ncbi:MAG TPA: hypothetical protein VM847_12500 [Tahibacter sp.]|jgi:hypothetical protein|nr:hypothetical protein [Tahibacter sp.]
MDIRLCTFRLDARAQQRTNLAAGLLAAHGYRVDVAVWDGADCALLLIALDGEQARRSAALARVRGIPVLALSPDGESGTSDGLVVIEAEGTAAALAAALHGLLAQRKVSGSASPAVHSHSAGERRAKPRGGADMALVRLALDSRLRRGDVEATIRGRVIRMHAGSGRVTAQSLSDLLSARDLLGSTGWELTAQAAGRNLPPAGDVSASLDAFYVVGALRAQAVLPAFPDQAMELRDWPDLGTAPEAVVALQVARLLSRRGAGWRAAAQAAGLRAGEVNACLWAFAAAHLLAMPQAGAAAPVPPPVPPRRFGERVMRGLARRFGLAWRDA